MYVASIVMQTVCRTYRYVANTEEEMCRSFLPHCAEEYIDVANTDAHGVQIVGGVLSGSMFGGGSVIQQSLLSASLHSLL